MINTGDKINWHGGWGRQLPKEAHITSIELCEKIGDKYGFPVDNIYDSDKDRCCFGLDNGHWAYGYQLDIIKK